MNQNPLSRIFHLISLLILFWSPHAYCQVEWRQGTAYFDDGTSITGKMHLAFSEYHVRLGKDIVRLPIKDIKSLEFKMVEKGAYSSEGWYLPVISADLVTSAGVTAAIQLGVGSKDDANVSIPSPFVFIQAPNPLTRVTDEQRFKWVGLDKRDNHGNGYFSKKIDNSRRVVRIEFSPLR